MFRFLMVVALALLTLSWVSSRTRDMRANGLTDLCTGGVCMEIQEPRDPMPGSVTLTSSEACNDSGYLCSELVIADSLRLLRWPENKGTLTVHVPAPMHEADEVGRRLQRAAVRGILAWSGHPFPIRVVERASALDGRPDVYIRWSTELDDSRLGQARVAWRGRKSGVEFEVTDFALVTRHPYQQRLLEEREVELTAAHEMGHALGLPHSDDPRDVMYPENTASHLSARDFRTMEAVYRLANGALVVR